MLNLMSTDIHSSSMFAVLPRFEEVFFKGFVADNVQHFEATREGETCSILSLTTIRHEEKFFWESCRELLEHSIQLAGQDIRGVYSFDLMTFDALRELKTFSYQELARLMVSSSQKLSVGEQKLIKYSSCFGILRKLAAEDWGKITFRSSVEVFNKTPEQLDLLVKRLLNCLIPLKGNKIAVICDLSQDAIWQPDNVEQRQRLIKFFEKQHDLFATSPEIYIRHDHHSIDVMRELGIL